MLQALSDPTRFEIFQCIRGCGGQSAYDTQTGECDGGTRDSVAACEVRCKVPCSPSSMSRHFGALRDAGLITIDRRGRELYAQVSQDAVQKLAAFFASEQACCQSNEVRKEVTHV
ncbi:hypothetical protein BH11ARM1_BH11ARM1_02380 [soil metagenome]